MNLSRKSKSHRRAPASREDGVALVITLSMLLITTIIIVAFFSRASYDLKATSSYSSSVQSDFLASGAMDQIIGNFLQEITDPTKSTTTTTNGFTWYEPVVAQDKPNMYTSMVPEKANSNSVATSAAYSNLIKQSTGDKGFYGKAPILASSVRADDSTLPNSRPVSAKRWSEPDLLGDDTGLLADTSTPVPDWIYVQANGATTTTSPKNDNSDQVVGRYAYNIYDVGGLININVSGYKTGATIADIATKGTAALIDLTALPGLLNDQASVDKIMAWRTPYVDWKTWLPSGQTPNDPISTSGSLPLQSYLQVGANTGWLRNPSVAASQGNQFFSRRDLIKFFFDNQLSRNALPFLTHFSVDADAPTFSPNTTNLKIIANRIRESTGSDPYIIPGQKQIQINPSRFDKDAIIPAFQLPNGKTAPTPVLRKRFPLSFLAIVATDPVVRSKADPTKTLAKRYFGLNEVNSYTWEYVDAGGGRDHIKTLDQVALENRDPNFFEILKSIIQVGSLGQYKNPIGSLPESSLEPDADRIDEQIIRIGACMIDQADADSFPTRIRFNYRNLIAQFGEICGVEDLPYISSMRFVTFSTSDSNTASKVILAQPCLWDPHDPSRRPSVKGSQISNFQIVPYQYGSPIDVRSAGGAWAAFTPTPLTASSAIKFNWDPTSLTFRQPQGLLSTSYPPQTIQSGPSYQVAMTQENEVYQGDLTPPPYPTGLAVGFFIGTNANASPAPKAADFKNNISCLYTGGPVQFSLQYMAPDGNFYPYDTLWFNPNKLGTSHKTASYTTFAAASAGNTNPDTSNFQTIRTEAVLMKSDPRSQRFIWPADQARFTGPSHSSNYYPMFEGTALGFYGGLYSANFFSPSTAPGNEVLLATTTPPKGEWNLTTDPAVSGGSPNDLYPLNSSWGFRADLGFLSINSKEMYNANGGMYYLDQDGVARRAMGGLVQSSNLPHPTNLQPMRTGTQTTASIGVGLPMKSNLMHTATAETGTDSYPSRPIVLNRPFRSVGELANAFRDVPWKNVDFSFPESGDTGLLDVFTVYENGGQSDFPTPLVAGKVNLNTAPSQVLTALLQGASRQIPTDLPTSNDWEITRLNNGSSILTAIVNRISQYRSTTGSAGEGNTDSNGPLRSLSELVGRVYSGGKGKFSDTASFVGVHPEAIAGISGIDQVSQERLSALVRSLADQGTVRTWNFMIDLVAQSGKIKSNGALTDFAANSESHCWAFISIDRFTGKILARSVERVTE